MDLLPENMPVWVRGFVSSHTLRAVTLPSCFLSVWIFTMRTESKLRQGFFSSCSSLKGVSLTEGFPLNNNFYDLDRPRPCLLFLKPETTRVRLMFKKSSGWRLLHTKCQNMLCRAQFLEISLTFFFFLIPSLCFQYKISDQIRSEVLNCENVN